MKKKKKAQKKKKLIPYSTRFLYHNYLASMDVNKNSYNVECMTRIILRDKYKPDIKSIKAAMKFMAKYDKGRYDKCHMKNVK